MTYDDMPTIVPPGTKWPLNMAPGSGTTRGRRPITPKERPRASFIQAVWGRAKVVRRRGEEREESGEACWIG
jgi:hypothetical protein